uniref:Uncharacterized protein n=1 Tax=Lepeophtheirus salmonis TaxID=72036 RepID=A0A0K2VE08_LEPSM
MLRFKIHRFLIRIMRSTFILNICFVSILISSVVDNLYASIWKINSIGACSCSPIPFFLDFKICIMICITYSILILVLWNDLKMNH